jgi:formate hydrogenlyase subunit 4
MTMTTLSYLLVQFAVVLLLAPLPSGVIRKVKALVQKRKGAPLLQMYRDLWKTLHKSSVVSDTTSWIFRAAPYVVFATSLFAALLVPATAKILPSAFPGDLILLFFVLALGRFFLVLSGMDAGSTFGGMGSSRETLISALVEPAVLLGVFTVGLFAKTTSIPGVLAATSAMPFPLLSPALLLVFLALFLVLLAETSRIPVDDPATHLELTMVHEAMILENSGRHLALMEYGAALKQLALLGLLVDLFLPFDPFTALAGAAGILLSVLFFAAKVLLLSLLVGAVESATVKLRFFSVPNLAALAFILSFLGLLQLLVPGR